MRPHDLATGADVPAHLRCRRQARDPCPAGQNLSVARADDGAAAPLTGEHAAVSRRDLLRRGLLAAGAAVAGGEVLRRGATHRPAGDAAGAPGGGVAGAPALRRRGAMRARPGAQRLEATTSSGRLRLGTMVTTPSLDPLLGLGGAALGAVYDALTAIEPGSHAVLGRLAASRRQASPTELDLRLDPAAIFSDGTAVTAGDVAFSLDQLLGSGSPVAALLAGVTRVEAPDAGTVRVVTAAPDPLLTRRLAAAAVVSRAAYRSAPAGSPPALVGSGFYVVSGFQADGSISLAASSRSWRGPAPLARLEVSEAVTPAGLLAALSDGALEVAEDLPSGAAEELAGRCVVEPDPLDQLSYVVLDATKAPFADARVRRAANLAVDVPRLLGTVLHGAGSPLAGQLGVAGCVGFDPALDAVGHDPATARRLLASAGYGRGFRTVLAGPAMQRPLLEAIGRDLAAVGIDARLLLLGTLDWLEAMRAGSEFPMMLAELALAPLFDVGPAYASITGRGRTGFRPSFRDGELERLDAEQAGELDAGRRAALLRDMAAIVRRELPVLLLLSSTWFNGRWPDVAPLATLGPMLVIDSLRLTGNGAGGS
jgi:peptide/nickel transport system substrate-binding protein